MDTNSQQEMILISPNQLIALIRAELLNGVTSIPKESNITHTRKETAKMLHVSLVSLNKYEKKGILNPVRIGRRVLYCQKEIDAVLSGNFKYKRL